MTRKHDQDLMQAILKKDQAAVRTALEDGADPNANSDGATPMHLAALLGSPETLRIMTSHGGTPDARDDIGRTPLHYAALAPAERSAEVVKVLIDVGADVDAHDIRGCRPLDLAAGVRSQEIASMLVEAGATCMSDRKDWVQRVTSSGGTKSPSSDGTEGRNGP